MFLYIHFLCLLCLLSSAMFFIFVTSFRCLLPIYSSFFLSLISIFFFFSIFLLLSYLFFLYLIFSYFSPYYSFFFPYFNSLSNHYNKRTCYTQSSYDECRLKVCAKRSMTVSSIKAVCLFHQYSCVACYLNHILILLVFRVFVDVSLGVLF